MPSNAFLDSGNTPLTSFALSSHRFILTLPNDAFNFICGFLVPIIPHTSLMPIVFAISSLDMSLAPEVTYGETLTGPWFDDRT